MRKWDDLSMREKAEMMRVAVSNGITTLPEIKQAYNEFAEGGAMLEAQPAENDGWSMDGNLFGGGGYKPSERIKQRIAHYEGKAMTGATDPLSGKWAKNNSFESEAKNFYNALPRDIREQVLSNPELADSLYSYSYNVGAGRFKERVVPALRNYYNGKGTVQDIENSMWASGDSKLRGLQRRRAEEMKGVRNALIGDVPYLPSDTPSYPTIYDMPQYIPAQPQAFSAPLTSYQPVMLPDEQQPIVREAMAYDPKEIERQERQRGLNNFMTLMSMASPQQNNGMFGAISMLSGLGTTNAYREGGDIYIRPENRGKFTALKERTGHSATWFKEHGTPAQKKMATFALNARHWKHADGGNLFNSEETTTQQMDRPNIFRYDNGRYVYQAAPDAEEIEVSPINTLLPNPSQWTYQDASGKIYTPHAAQVDTGSIIQDEERNPLVRAANNYFREAAYRAKDGTLALQGKYTMPAIAASALLPLAGEAAYPLLTNPYVDAVATSAFGAHGLNHAINEGINGWGDAAMTALEVAPLGRLARPMFKEAALAVENYRYPFGRPQVPEGYVTVKPQVRTRVGDVEIDNPNLLYHLDRGDSAGAFSNQGAYVEDGKLLPGIAKEGEIPYSWWNLGRPYATGVNGQPMTRLMTTTKDTPGMLHVRSQNYSIGQWNGKRGLVTNAEYVNPEGVNISESTYTLDPNYGWRRLFAEDASTAKWADVVKTPQITAENELAQNESLKNMFRRILRGKPDDIKITKEMAEMGRKDLLNEISSPWYKERWKKATNGNDEQIDKLLSRMRDRIIDVPIDYSKTTEQLGGEPGFVTYGVTVPREPHKFNLSDGTPVTDYNTGLDVLVAANRGKEARNTAYHELQHYLTNKATGTTPYPSLKFINNGPYKPLITPLDNGELLIGRGDAWQHYIMDQNEALLPKRSLAHEEAVYYPESLKKRITELGRTPEEADNLILKLRDEAQDMMSIQEQRAHLKTWFTKNILPYLKNSNDASEIERVLNEHPSIMKNRPENIKTLMETLRPGSVKDYAKYLAESLGIIPFINKNSKAE